MYLQPDVITAPSVTLPIVTSSIDVKSSEAGNSTDPKLTTAISTPITATISKATVQSSINSKRENVATFSPLPPKGEKFETATVNNEVSQAESLMVNMNQFAIYMNQLERKIFCLKIILATVFGLMIICSCILGVIFYSSMNSSDVT